MRYILMSFFRKITAFFSSILMLLGIGVGDTVEYVPLGDENTVSSYSVENSDYSLAINAADEVHEISELLYGIFFEDINFAADGGLYAEMVINRSFEYGELATDDELHGWSGVGASDYSVTVGDADGGLNSNNTNYIVINNTSGEKAGVANRGFLDGMAIEKDVTYDCSVYAKALEDYSGKITIRLVAGEEIAAEAVIDSITSDWVKYELELTSSLTADSEVYLQVLVDNGKVALDMVSLFPPTYNSHGMRTDLAQLLAEMEPAFLRFPGGCVIEGYDEETAYNWKDSIGVDENGDPLEFNGTYGDVAARSYGINIWTDTVATEDPLPCYMSYGLGFYEYFVLAEDIGAIGVPVLNCGLYCQMRGRGPVDMYTEEFEQYLQDMVDLVEFCRGDETTKWGSVRIAMGHEEPFELKYICIGNENEAGDYYERYEAFLARFNEEKEKNSELYEGIELIYSAGAAEATSGWNYYNSYVNAYEYVAENDITIEEYAGAIDQHYYMTPTWFLNNTDYYDEDNYVRDYENMTDTIYGGAIQVFVGEYAAKSNTLEAALAEAAYMTGLERNGDIVKMAAYAPLFGNLTATHWAPDLIWFGNNDATGSVNYYIQKLFSTNAGTSLIASTLDGADIVEDDLSGMVGLGTWNTTAEFDNVKVVDNETGEILSEDSFDSPCWFWDWYKKTDGKWTVCDGKFAQTELYPDYSELGSCVYYGDTEWSNYTFTVEATKTEGEEGFYIPFLIQDEDNCFYWNIGGWSNTQTALQRIENGVKTGSINGTVTDFTVQEGVTYEIKIVVDGTNIKGYIDDVLQFDYDAVSDSNAEAYQVVSTDESGDIIIKLVNVTENDRTFAIDISNAENIGSTATVYQVSGQSLSDENILGEEETCEMVEFTVDGISEQFNYTVPQYSATIIRITK